jgi:alkylation response protein AidB-like acyl-CoA dehydrogenase
MPSLELTPELRAYQERVRSHIAEHRPEMPRLPGTRSPEPGDMPAYRRWCASLFDAGLVGSDWPAENGGGEKSDPVRAYVLEQELAAAGVPRPIGAWNLVSPALFASGSAEQKDRYLPRIRRFEDLWCQLFSEPGAGSDLAALRAAAIRDGDEWVVSGQKVWTTHAHVADLGFLLARTDPTAPKHAGISAFIVDMTLPGISVRPLREMTGSSDFNEVFFDEVRLPAGSIIGAPGAGWPIARAALAHERAASLHEDSTTASVRRLSVALARTNRDGSSLLDGAGTREELGRLHARASVVQLLGLRGVLKEAAGRSSINDAPVVKVLFSETNLEIVTSALDLLGADGVLTEGDPAVVDGGHWQRAFLYARGFTISAGSHEIMRNVIAERGLGLPK